MKIREYFQNAFNEIILDLYDKGYSTMESAVSLSEDELKEITKSDPELVSAFCSLTKHYGEKHSLIKNDSVIDEVKDETNTPIVPNETVANPEPIKAQSAEIGKADDEPLAINEELPETPSEEPQNDVNAESIDNTIDVPKEESVIAGSDDMQESSDNTQTESVNIAESSEFKANEDSKSDENSAQTVAAPPKGFSTLKYDSSLLGWKFYVLNSTLLLNAIDKYKIRISDECTQYIKNTYPTLTLYNCIACTFSVNPLYKGECVEIAKIATQKVLEDGHQSYPNAPEWDDSLSNNHEELIKYIRKSLCAIYPDWQEKVNKVNSFLNDLDDKRLTIFKARCDKDLTFGEISEQIDLSKQRVSDLFNNICRAIHSTTDFKYDLLPALFSIGIWAISPCELTTIIGNDLLTKYLVFEPSKTIKVGKAQGWSTILFSPLFGNNADFAYWNDALIHNGVNLHKATTEINSKIKSLMLPFFNYDEWMFYCEAQGAFLTGPYLKDAIPDEYDVLADYIELHFPNGIKIDQGDKAEDLDKLRSLIRKEIPDIELKADNHNIHAYFIRTKLLIRCDRGSYVSPANAYLDKTVLDGVKGTLISSGKSKIRIEDAYKVCKEKLSDTPIQNGYYLSGVIQYLYPEDFSYLKSVITIKANSPKIDETNITPQ